MFTLTLPLCPCETTPAIDKSDRFVCKNAQVDWDDLRYVLAVRRAGSLSQAATSLGVTHTTVGRRIRAIEEQLGVQLFDRTPEGYVSTVAGQDIAEVAERVEDEVLSVEGRVLGRDAQLRGQLRVSTLDFIFAHFHAAFSSFVARYPSVQLTVTAPTDQVSLTRREADVALRMSNSPPEYLIGRKVGRIEFAVYASKTLAERIGANASYGDFPWISWDERLTPSWLDPWLAQHAPGAKVVLRTDGSTSVLRKCVSAGIGVHFLPCFEADADPSLRRVGKVETDFGRDLWLLTLPDLRGNTRIRAFMDHMEEALRASRAAMAGTGPQRRADRRATRKGPR